MKTKKNSLRDGVLAEAIGAGAPRAVLQTDPLVELIELADQSPIFDHMAKHFAATFTDAKRKAA